MCKIRKPYMLLLQKTKVNKDKQKEINKKIWKYSKMEFINAMCKFRGLGIL